MYEKKRDNYSAQSSSYEQIIQRLMLSFVLSSLIFSIPLICNRCTLSLSQRETQQPLNKCEQLEHRMEYWTKKVIQKTTKESKIKNEKLQKNKMEEGEKRENPSKGTKSLELSACYILSLSTVNVHFQINWLITKNFLSLLC